MTTGETLYLLLVLVTFIGFAAVLAYLTHQQGMWRAAQTASKTQTSAESRSLHDGSIHV